MRTRKGGFFSSFAKSVKKSVKSVGRSVGIYKGDHDFAHHLTPDRRKIARGSDLKSEPKSEQSEPSKSQLAFPHQNDIDAWKRFIRGFDWHKLNNDASLVALRDRIIRTMPDEVFKTMFDKDMLLLPESKPASKPESKPSKSKWWPWTRKKHSPHKIRRYEDLDAHGKLDAWMGHTGPVGGRKKN